MVRTGGTREIVKSRSVFSLSVKKPGHRKRNAPIGLAVGAGAGLGIGLAARCTGTCLQIVPNGAVVAAATAGGAVVGLAVGALLPTGEWREIYRFKPPPIPYLKRVARDAKAAQRFVLATSRASAGIPDRDR